MTERIQKLYDIRNKAYFMVDELKSVETPCKKIMKQIDQYIN